MGVLLMAETVHQNHNYNYEQLNNSSTSSSSKNINNCCDLVKKLNKNVDENFIKKKFIQSAPKKKWIRHYLLGEKFFYHLNKMHRSLRKMRY